ncbi:hypothetical protein HNY73_017441 [Argiope bruennichi]|uniref:Uncharacterized protein n=1 Tax=Argiope bruennichi TaxID=94029 RepID=A0A8T0EB04_ARGBR|nr:hypothetical protein HNY73_017441 [Argiope bruennichi]
MTGETPEFFERYLTNLCSRARASTRNIMENGDTSAMHQLVLAAGGRGVNLKWFSLSAAPDADEMLMVETLFHFPVSCAEINSGTFVILCSVGSEKVTRVLNSECLISSASRVPQSVRVRFVPTHPLRTERDEEAVVSDITSPRLRTVMSRRGVVQCRPIYIWHALSTCRSAWKACQNVDGKGISTNVQCLSVDRSCTNQNADIE